MTCSEPTVLVELDVLDESEPEVVVELVPLQVTPSRSINIGESLIKIIVIPQRNLPRSYCHFRQL